VGAPTLHEPDRQQRERENPAGSRPPTVISPDRPLRAGGVYNGAVPIHRLTAVAPALLVFALASACGSSTGDTAGRSTSSGTVPPSAFQPVTARALLSAPVPALRGPAGKLVDGMLAQGGGGVVLERAGAAAPVFGDLTGDGVPDGAAVLTATTGIGGSDQYVELYTDGHRPLGSFNPAAVSAGRHALVRSLGLHGREVDVAWASEGSPADPALSSWTATLTWDGARVVAKANRA
jgi:hypothetical protein